MDDKKGVFQKMHNLFGLSDDKSASTDKASLFPAKKDQPTLEKKSGSKFDPKQKVEIKPKFESKAAEPKPEVKADKKETAQPVAVTSVVVRPKTCLAPGTIFEGTLKTEGDVDIGGKFSGAVMSKGTVTLRALIESNIMAENLTMIGASLKGDVQVTGMVDADENSRINGKVCAQDFGCAGTVVGDIFVTGNLSLRSTARVNGDIHAASLSIERGAEISGTVEMKNKAVSSSEG